MGSPSARAAAPTSDPHVFKRRCLAYLGEAAAPLKVGAFRPPGRRQPSKAADGGAKGSWALRTLGYCRRRIRRVACWSHEVRRSPPACHLKRVAQPWRDGKLYPRGRLASASPTNRATPCFVGRYPPCSACWPRQWRAAKHHYKYLVTRLRATEAPHTFRHAGHPAALARRQSLGCDAALAWRRG